MSEDNDRLVSKHDYDGILEYDNPLPLWWLVTFFITIFFAFHYFLHYESGVGLTQKAELKEDMDRIQAFKGPDKADSEEELLALSHSPAALLAGKDIFTAKCSVCHGLQLQGIIGPNLVDEFWIHGDGRLTSITAIIRSGVPDKGMPNWGVQLKNNEIQELAVYIASQAGTKPPQAKPPQGEKVAPH